MVSPYVLIRATRKGIYLAANAEVDGYITLTFCFVCSLDEPLRQLVDRNPKDWIKSSYTQVR